MSRSSADGVARALLPRHDIQISVAVATHAARLGREKHQLRAAAAALLGQGLTGAALVASLQKNESRINLQVACDGPLRGLFVDASSTTGDVRGYVKNPFAEVELSNGPFRWRGALGNAGYLAVLRDIGKGEFYRSSVELTAMSLAEDLNHYFETSDQVATRVAIDLVRAGDEGLGAVGGVLVQALPNGDAARVAELGSTLPAALVRALNEPQPLTATSLLATLFPADEVDVTFTGPLQWRCTCSKARVMETLAALGRAEVQDLLDTQGSAAIVCQFCATRHEATFHDLVTLLESMGGAPTKN
ncbi:MAG: Hsp33 family molecular chaperone HslO [Archangium sp.]|nr:Hsp33 family molecular chaperone HslO [Archangium sp.]